MLDGPAVRLAVARLTETGQDAVRFRQEPDRPLEGYCLVSGDERHCRVTIFVENGRTLNDRRPGGAFYYEGWIVGMSAPVSIGVFNTGATGGGSGTCIRTIEELGLTGPATIRVTAEPFGGSQAGAVPVLEGPLIWLHGQPAASGPLPVVERRVDPLPEAVPVGAAAPSPETAPPLQPAGQETEPVPEPDRAHPEQTAGVPADSPPLPTSAPSGEEHSLPVAAADRDAPIPPEPDPGPEAPDPAETMPNPTAAGPAAVAPGVPETAAEAAPETPRDSTEPVTGMPAETSSAAAPAAPAAPQAAPATLTVTLHSRHPMAPRAAGTATLHLREGRIAVTLRGLPSPAALGRVPGLDRPFNGYRLWLINQRSGLRHPLGPLTRVWGENFRTEEGPGLPLARYDTLLITADDRKAPSPDPHWPPVVVGSIDSRSE